MNKNSIQKVCGVSIYPIEYLTSVELTDNDLSNLLDNGKIGLKYSLIINMFKFIKSTKRNNQIIKLIKTDKDWYKKITWSKKQYDEYENLVIDTYKNIYQYKDLQAISLGQWFMTLYGFKVEGNKFDI